MEYTIVKANTAEQLQERVQEMIEEDGWKPIGGAQVVSIEPAMTKKWRYDHRPRTQEFIQSMTREAQE